MNKPFFSIIIPAHNEEKLLPRLLDSLEAQQFREFEVIVAEHGSTDKTPAIISKYGAITVEGGPKPGIGRNNGAKIAKGEYLVFLDADTRVRIGFLKELKQQIEKRGFVAASGFFRGDGGSAFDKITHTILNYYFWILQKIDPHACGFYFVVKRDIFEQLGGFDPRIVMAEDHDLAWRISKIGKFSFLRNPKVTVSVRRIEREGFIATVSKGIYVELYRIFSNKKITKRLFKYEMGGEIKK